MQVSLYRSVLHATYPEEAMRYRYAFQPIVAEEEMREGILISWVDDSGSEPFAVIEVPYACEFVRADDGWHLMVPGTPYDIHAEDLLELAIDSILGMSVVQAPRAIADRNFWCSSI